MRVKRLLVVAICGSLILAACGSDDSPGDGVPVEKLDEPVPGRRSPGLGASEDRHAESARS